MFASVKSVITTDASGDATVFLEHSVNSNPNGFLVSLKYTPGNIATGATLVITGESTGIPIMTKANAGTSVVFFFPRALLNAVADGAAASSPSEFIPIENERIKVVVSGGGDGGVGEIKATLVINPPY